MKSNKQPEIRFPGFTKEWEQRKLREVLKVNSGRDYKHLNKGSIPVYGTGGYMLSVDDKLSDIDGIGIGRKGTIDKPQYLKAPYWTVDTLFYMTSFENNDLLFLLTLSQKINWKKMDESTGVPSLSKTVIENVGQYLPVYDEQIEIGKFFKQLDDTIVFFQQELAVLKETKQGFLQKIFPKEGEKVPEIRFPGFTNDWEQHKVESMSEKTYGGGTPKTQIDEYWQGDFPWIQSSDLKIDELNNVNPQKFITEEAIKNSATKAIPEKSIAIVTRVGVGKLAYLNYSYSTSQDFLSLSKLTVDPFFGVYGLYRLIKKELNNIQGTSIKGMTKSDLLDKKLYIPDTTEEQQKIGVFFKQLDDTIALHQRELDLLKETKKAFLQKMFV